MSSVHGKAEPGHECTPDHLAADLALIQNAPKVVKFTPEDERTFAERGIAQTMVDMQKGLAAVEQSQKQQEKRLRRSTRSSREPVF